LDGASARRKASLPTHKTTHRINACNTDIHELSGIRTHDPNVRAREDSSCLRPRGHCVRLVKLLTRPNLVPNLRTPPTLCLHDVFRNELYILTLLLVYFTSCRNCAWVYPPVSSGVIITNDELGSASKEELLYFVKTLSPNVPPVGAREKIYYSQ
jgi:hypothetical protein